MFSGKFIVIIRTLAFFLLAACTLVTPISAENVDPGVTLEQQLQVVNKNLEVVRFQEMRHAKADDPYRPLYHFSTPEGVLNDPNGFCYWKGHYHLCYQLKVMGSHGMQWGHAYSRDLVHWQDLPIAIRTDSGAIYSGQVLVEHERVIAMYHNTAQGNCVAVASDPLLLNLTKLAANPVVALGKVKGEGFQKPYDPCIWKGKDGMYYSVSGVCKNGGRNRNGFPVADLFRSRDLEQWKYLGLLMEDEDWTRVGLGPGDDAAVPNFQPLGWRDGSFSGKHMFLWFSHGKGAHALVGTYDESAHHLVPESYYRMTFGPVYKGTLHAPSAMLDKDGRCVAIFNIRENKQDVQEALRTRSSKVWYGVMTLARHLWLAEDHSLRLAPAGDLASLRFDHKQISAQRIPEDQEVVLQGIEGQAMEIKAVLSGNGAKVIGLNMLRSPDGSERTTIRLHMDRDQDGTRKLELDVSKGSRRQDVPDRASEIGPLQLDDGEDLELHVFIDRSVVEVFANQKQCLTARVYPAGEDSKTVSVFANGGDAVLRSLDAWKMRSVWPELKSFEGN